MQPAEELHSDASERATAPGLEGPIPAPEEPATPPASITGRGRPRHYWDRQVVEEYDRRYRRGWARWKHVRKQKILGRWIHSGDTLLEVACGPGRFHSLGGERVALDLSMPMLRRYRQAVPEAILVRGDAIRLPFRSDSFDVVVAIRFLSHLRGEYRRAVLQELARVARRAVLLDGRHRYNFRFVSRRIRHRLGLARADKLRFRYSEFSQELESVGLRLAESRSVAWGLSARCLLRAEPSPGEVVPPSEPR